MTKGQTVLSSCCAIEALTGLGLLVAPEVVAKLLLGSEITGVATVVVNVAGIALISLAIACWPRADAKNSGSYLAMLVYNLLVTLLHAKSGATAMATGVLLWPVVVIHSLLTVLIALALIDNRRAVPLDS